jgi:hypothetical protein
VAARLSFAVTLLVCLAVPASAQFLSRPWLDWRTIETPRFTFYFPAQFEGWTRDVAERIESIDSAVTQLVGFTPAARTRIIVDDPYNVSNGFALPFVDRPLITFWVTPPDPRESIGNFRSWGEMLAVHEFAHVAHLARPSRNPLTRFFWQLLPLRMGPIATRSPRWVMEGYATFVEGRITSSGRPNNAWRATILRQWALEGRLPTYEQLSAWGDFEGADFAYLAGSAFLEWLAARQGDSSLVLVWRRLTARTTRSFDEAFAGVYGESPRNLYGLFTVDLTTRAVAARERLAAAGLVEGELVQRLSWQTGDPAVADDGRHLAVVLRSRGRPSRVVVWNTAPEPDTLAARAASRLLARDPQDVPARRIYPPPRKPLATLPARNGRSYEEPRFLPNGRDVLLSRSSVRPDGSLRPDLYLWTVPTGRVRRVTVGASLREADPTPDGRRATAVRCAGGRCDLVMVDLFGGAIHTLLPGSVTTSFYRPRVSPDGRAIAVAVQRDDRWRIALVDPDAPAVRYVDPDDGANRFDAAWTPDGALIVVSDRGGIADLERLDPTTHAVQPLTRVTGAAVAPTVNRADGSVWFLALHSHGYDLRRLATPVPIAGRVALDSTLVPAIPGRGAPTATLVRHPAGPTRRYPVGARTLFWVPVGSANADGVEGGIALESIDIVGRLSLLGAARAGGDGAWRGASLRAAWRGWRPELGASAFTARQLPSRTAAAPLVGDALDETMSGGSLDASIDLFGDGFAVTGSLLATGARLEGPPARGDGTRAMAGGRIGARMSHIGKDTRAAATLSASASGGRTRDSSFARWIATLGASASSRALLAVAASAYVGRITDDAPAFERFALGGMTPPLVDPELLPQRIPFAALPTGSAIGTEILGYRVETPGVLTPYLTAARLTTRGARATWHRAYGVEITAATPPIAPIGTPGGQITLGIARSIDAPFERRVQGYFSVRVSP